MQSHLDASTKMQRLLAGKVAIVTGSTSGIGLGIARALAEAGSAVVLNGLGDMDEVKKTRVALEQATGVRVAYDAANLMDAAETAALVQRTEQQIGRVDILVNNAGIQNQILALNLSAVFHATKAAFKGMKERKFGRVINVASAHGLVASAFKSAYVAAKHGVVGLTKVTALEGAEHNVTANAICPGYVWTPLVEKQIDDQAKAHNISREKVIREVLLVNQPNKKFATVEEMGALAVFLASDMAASITGTALPVDGGWTAH
jgi:3-hydroxybutyrate dehydrogenase